MINLIEHYDQYSSDLILSLKKSSFNHPTVVLHDDGFLPEGIHSPINFFTQLVPPRKTIGLFFNQVAVPFGWEIRGDSQKAEIYNGYQKVGHIHYSQHPGNYRIVKAVDWLNPKGDVRSTDCYNQYGQIFARQTHSDNHLTLTTYLDNKQREIILYNHTTQTVQLLYRDKYYIFTSYQEFSIFYLEVVGFDCTQIFYNNLSMSLLVTEILRYKYPEQQFSHTLFWQETSKAMPANMRAIFENKATTTKRIIVQNPREYERLKAQTLLLTSRIEMSYLGYLFEYKKDRVTNNKEIFILTYSDQLEEFDILINKLKDFHFHIAARTLMSNKLLSYSKKANVTLYPNIDDQGIVHLFKTTSIYLDINHGNEVDRAVRQAFEHQQLIFAFTNTLHQEMYVAPQHVFNPLRVEDMFTTIYLTTKDYKHFKEALILQIQSARLANIEDYENLLRK